MSDLVTIAAYTDQTEAMVARSVLEAAGIDCLLKGEHQIGIQQKEEMLMVMLILSCF